ncbi:hypothetical protein OZ410_05825 [Robiginitalea sp. M366]|uniref:hypothetical protein n=1 Tax=Robiginitalea aestuariiviva TaxID=3036903 RepID=UPI00240D646B|nr:hypothetical protein [Robiginitalea aestuariiviva]MDG1571826.1 hypothetical protein [Robiginitalea aestuariiviva]
MATLAGTVVMFILGYLIWGMATASFFEVHSLSDTMKDDSEMSMLMIFLGNLVMAFAMSSLYGKWSRGHHSASEGLQFGAWIGIFIGVGMNLLWYGTSKLMDATGHMAEGVLDIIFYAIIGMVIALVYKATAAKAAA